MILCGDSLIELKKLPSESVDCCITSPPYWGLRDYGIDGQLGLEKTPEEYVAKMVEIFQEVKRVLKNEGTLWLNLGDSYVGGNFRYGTDDLGDSKQGTNRGSRIIADNVKRPNIPEGHKPKDLTGIPWMVAFALKADGWYLRQDIIWHKPNPMPESVTDRCTKAHEYIFLLSKSAKYYFDNEAIKEPLASASIDRLSQDIKNQEGASRVPFKTNGNMKAVCHKTACTPGQSPHTKALKRMNGEADPIYQNRNKRSVWTVTTKPFREAHFATFPEDLIFPCVLAGCPKGGIILDPFSGAGTTGVVAKKNFREFIGLELNPKYIEIANKRIESVGMF